MNRFHFISQWTTLVQDPKSMNVRGVPVGCLLHSICLKAHHHPKHLSPESSNSRKRKLLGTPLRSGEAVTPHKMYDLRGGTQDVPLLVQSNWMQNSTCSLTQPQPAWKLVASSTTPMTRKQRNTRIHTITHLEYL